ncbi:efflux RND transporter periplasmic adaptor subunit [Salinimicrobium sp. CDJ15-81-2]|nr:efflux RND transporter periplasmic adaptor subunit [Salinimicrobium nanhaiense]
MKNSYKSIYAIVFSVLLLFSCGNGDEAQQEQTEKAVAVEAQQVQRHDFPQIIEYTANVEAWETAYITGQNGVRIDEIYVSEGEQVRKGQLLATMNSSQLSQAQAQLDLARREVERLDTLVQIGAVSGQRLDQAQTELQNALSNFQSLGQNTRLTANFNGVITAKYFSEGEMYMPSADAPAILTLMQLEPVKVTIRIGERFYDQVEEGMPATVRTDVYPDEEFMGEVYRVFPTIDRNSRTFQTEIRIENDERRLRPGMFARVMLNLGEIEGIYVPSTAVVNQPGTTNRYVFLKEGDSVTRVNVQTGNRYQDQIRILSGLEAGQTIITEGIGKLNEGTRVRLMGKPAQQAL